MSLAKSEYSAGPAAVDRSRRRFMRHNLLALALAPRGQRAGQRKRLGD
jgi:hypothetical protein